VGTVTATPVGTAVNIGVLRKGQHENFKVVVGDLAQIFPDKFGGPQDEARSQTESGVASFGMMVQNLSDAKRQTLGLKTAGGVEVVSVDPNSFADDIQLKKGDIIVSLNQHPVNSTDDLKRIQATLKPGDAVAFRVMTRQGRGGDWTSSYVAGTLPNTVR